MHSQASHLSFVVLLCISLAWAAITPVTLYTNGANGNAKAANVVNTQCASMSGVIILTDSSTTCVTYVSNTGAINSTFCPVELQGATSLSCTASSNYWSNIMTAGVNQRSYCFAANPTTGSIVVFTLSKDGTSLSVKTTITTAGTVTLTAPNYLAMYLYSGTVVSTLVAGFSGTQIIVYKFLYDFNDASYALTILTTITSSAQAAGLYTHPSYFLVAAVGDNTFAAYTYIGVSTTSSFGTPSLTHIDSLSSDYLYNLYVGSTVGGVSNVQVFSGSSVIDTWTLSHPATAILHSNDAHFVVDSTGVLIGNKAAISLVSYSATNATCKQGSITTTVAGGALPYTFILNPTWTTYSSQYTASYTFATGLSTVQPVPDATMYNNGKILLHFNVASTGGNIENKTSTAVVRTGNTYSYSIATVYGGITYLWCTSCVNAAYYNTVEVWINVGSGGQYFSLQFHPADIRYYQPGDFPLNTWVKVTFDYSSYWYINYGYFKVIDTRTTTGPTQNPIYLDGMVLKAYTDMSPRVRVRDSCGVEVATPSFTITDDLALRVTTDTPNVTCSPFSYDDALASDATLTATATGGVPPYSYSWSFSSSTSNVVYNQPAMTARMLVYDNAMNYAGGWGDSYFYGSTMNPQDSTYYRSPPYSYSFAPTKYFDGLYFYHDALNIADYYAYEFWVNGGPNGQQFITAVVDSDSPYPVNPLEYYSGAPYIPANKWIKVILPIPTVTQSSTFFGIQVAAQRDGVQERVYIDDMYLIASNTAIATDSLGCTVSDHYIDITAPDVISVSLDLDYVKCFNTPTGSVYATATGGTPPYSYNWTIDGVAPIPLSSPNATHLPEVFVYVEVLDSNGCHAPYQMSTAVDSPPILEVKTTYSNAVCHGGLGSLTATALGGTGPYTYKWGSSTGTVFNTTLQPNPFAIYVDELQAPFTLFGSYAVFFQGTHRGIVQTLPVHYSHSGHKSIAAVPYDIGNSAPYYNFSIPDNYISLSLGCINCIDLTIWRGVSLWFACDPAVVTNMSIWLIKGNVSISPPLYFKDVPTLVTTGDAIWQNVYFHFNNDTAQTADAILVLSSSPIPVAIYDDIVLMASKETSRSIVVGTQVNIGYNATVLASAGSYVVNVTDASGCPFQMKYNVTEPTRVTVDPWVFSNGSATLNVTGGSPPYTYNWVGLNTTTKYINNIATGIYTVEVTDSYGCMASTSVNVPVFFTIRTYDRSLSSGLGALVAVGGVVAIFSILMLVKFWAAFSALGSFYCAVLLFGVLLSYAAALTLLPRPTDTLCTAFPWLLGIAFNLVYGCLFIKTWGLYRVWANAKQYKRTNLTPLYIMKVEAVVVLSEIILMAIWTAIDPPRVHKMKVLANEYEYQCNTNHPTFWIIFLAIKGAWLVFGAVLSVLTRDVIKKYNESSSISYAIYNITVLCAIGVPLGILLEQVPGGRLVIEVVITVLAFTFTMVIMFFKSWYSALSDRTGEFNMGNYRHRNTQSTNSASGSPGNTHSSGSNAGTKGSKASTVSPAVSYASASASASTEPATLKVIPI